MGETHKQILKYSKMDELNYEKEMQIDESALDLEWLEQADLTMKYIQYAAEAEKDRDEKKEKMEYAYARLEKEIRSDPDSFGLGKLTESIVNNAILREKSYEKASQAYIDAKFEARVARGAVDAIRDKKEALQELGRLVQIGYTAAPKEPRDIVKNRREKRQAEDKKSNKNVAQKTTRRRKTNGNKK